MPKQFLKKTKIKPFSYIMAIALLSVVGYTVSLTSTQTVSAVTYQTGVGVSFTFNPKLTLTLSSSNLVISNLAPGTSDNSNEIAITVSTNAAYGYNLSATVGNSTTYNNTDLTHTSGSSAGKFSSIAFQSNPANYISSISSNNTWGYSIDSGTKYNGLPLYSDTTNIATLKSTDTTPSTGTDTVNFLIGAKASTTQPTGDYKNVINFMAVTNPTPMSLEQSYAAANKTKYNGYYKIQDMNQSICAAAELEDDILQVIDTRDNNVYKISKLKDGKCWMVENLNIAGGTALSSTDTDFDSSYTLPTTNGWTVTDGKLVLPASATSGFSSDNYASLYNSGRKENCGSSGQNTQCYSYYSWDTATVGSGRNLSSSSKDAPYSICPKGWRLPISGDQLNDDYKRGDFYTLASSYGANLESNYHADTGTGSNFYNNAGPNTIPNFLLSGQYQSSNSFDRGGSEGSYWSSTSDSGTSTARYFIFSPTDLYVTYSRFRSVGASVRCLSKE